MFPMVNDKKYISNVHTKERNYDNLSKVKKIALNIVRGLVANMLTL